MFQREAQNASFGERTETSDRNIRRKEDRVFVSGFCWFSFLFCQMGPRRRPPGPPLGRGGTVEGSYRHPCPPNGAPNNFLRLKYGTLIIVPRSQPP
jgi:hypothetical protein